MTHVEQKAALRQSVKQELKKLSVEVMTKESKELQSRLLQLRLVVMKHSPMQHKQMRPHVIWSAGQAVAQHIVHSKLFQRAKTVGVYLHCVKLKEVDTTPIVSAAVQAGKPLGEHKSPHPL